MPPYSHTVNPLPCYLDVAHVDRTVTTTSTTRSSSSSENVKAALNHSPVVRYPLTSIPEGVVRFAPLQADIVHTVPNKEECLQDGGKINGIWYTKSELTRIQQENRRLLRGYHRKTIASSSKDFCLRGLERQTTGGANRVLTNRLTCLYIVLEEQSRQYQLGINEPELLAHLAASTTSHCQKEAVMVGMDDAAHDCASGEIITQKTEDMICNVLFNPAKWFAPKEAAAASNRNTCL